MSKYPNDIFDGREVPPLVISENYELLGTHMGSIHVEQGTLWIRGHHNGSVHAHENCVVEITGTQNGSVHIESGAVVLVKGVMNGSAYVDFDSKLVIEAGGKYVGSLHNNGVVIIRGIYGGSVNGNGEVIVEENGRIVQPRIQNGNAYYEI